ncbi:MAG: hypothetical protein WC382_12675 [Methanoregulaceae archaeon]
MMELANPAIPSTPAFPVSWVPVRRDRDRAPEFMYRGDPAPARDMTCTPVPVCAPARIGHEHSLPDVCRLYGALQQLCCRPRGIRRKADDQILRDSDLFNFCPLPIWPQGSSGRTKGYSKEIPGETSGTAWMNRVSSPGLSAIRLA